MKIYAQKEFKLLQMNLGMKFITTVFLVLILAGYITGLLMGLLKTGVGINAVVDYYRGNESAGLYPRSALELLEVSHFHLFSTPVIYLIVSHMIMMTYLNLRVKVFLVLLGFVGMTVDLISPWLIRYVSGNFAWLKMIGSAAFGLSFLAMIFIEFYELFIRKVPYELTDVV